MTTQYKIYGNSGSGGPVDYSSALATVTSTTWSSSALSSSSSWKFGVRASDSGSGLEEKNVDARVSIVIGSGGQDLTSLPLAPKFLTLTPLANGSIRVTWLASVGRSPRPTGYHVYAGVGTVSYGSPAATSGPGDGLVVLTGYSDGASVAVAVRAYNAVGEEPNTITRTTVAIVTGPAAVVGLSGSATAIAGDGRS